MYGHDWYKITGYKMSFSGIPNLSQLSIGVKNCRTVQNPASGDVFGIDDMIQHIVSSVNCTDAETACSSVIAYSKVN